MLGGILGWRHGRTGLAAPCCALWPQVRYHPFPTSIPSTRSPPPHHPNPDPPPHPYPQGKLLVPPCITRSDKTGLVEMRIELDERSHRCCLSRVTADVVRVHVTGLMAGDAVHEELFDLISKVRAGARVRKCVWVGGGRGYGALIGRWPFMEQWEGPDPRCFQGVEERRGTVVAVCGASGFFQQPGESKKREDHDHVGKVRGEGADEERGLEWREVE